MKESGKAAGTYRGKNIEEKTKALQSFLSCLFYLVQEAKREDLAFVADVLKESISKIDRLSKGDELRHASATIIDHSLFEAMSFLHTLSGLTSKQLHGLYEDIRDSTPDHEQPPVSRVLREAEVFRSSSSVEG